MNKREKVFVGVSGGVDSSVALLRVIRAGYDATAVFIKTWQPDFITCNWEKERLDAMRVSAHLGVPFYTFDAVEAYKNEVAEYMIREYREGRTPNPDVMCNKEVKFGAFLSFALAHGASKVATGHYAQCIENNDIFELHRGIDDEKDQSYFLWTLSQEQLKHILFPIGNSKKTDVRKEAEKFGLPTSKKQDSQGICFLGPIDIPEFLSHYVNVSPGNVLNESGQIIGTHEGALMYTLGQRHGFTIITTQDSSRPFYVIKKDIEENTLTVSAQHRTCEGTQVLLTDMHSIIPKLPSQCEAQFRYRQKPFHVDIHIHDSKHGMLTVHDAHIEMPSCGQSCVLYNGTQCLGGGIINEIV